jgi:aspartate/methionine/tyrosine aminotransferase
MSRTIDVRTGATRMDAIQAPIVPVVGDWIRETPGTISLGQGVVHYGPPRQAVDAVRAALADSATHQYDSGVGLTPLVDLIAVKLRTENGIDVSNDARIMVTAGANMAFMHAVLTTTVPDDEVILPVPFYFNHEMAIQMAGCRAVGVPTDERYQLRMDAIRGAVTDRTRAIVTISPNNPSGAVLDAELLRELNAFCRERGIYHISDETYEYFTYGSARHVSPGSFPDAAGHTISLYSLSKAYGFAGWRIGYMAYPAHLEDGMLKTQDTILICPPIASQVAALGAMQVGRAHCAPYVKELASIRDIVTSELATLAPGVRVPAADGAFYCLLHVSNETLRSAPTAMTPMILAERLVREHKVAVIPGTAFGMSDGCYLRVAYGALQKATVAEGIGRLIDGLRTLLVLK